MSLAQKERLEEVFRIIDGTRALCQLLETPGVPPVSTEVLMVFECLFVREQELINSILALEKEQYEEKTGGKV